MAYSNLHPINLERTMRHPLRTLGLASALIGLACSGLEDEEYEYEEPIFDEVEPAVAAGPAGQDISAFSMSPGDCFQDSTETTVTDLEVVPCAQAHDNEVFYKFDVSQKSFDEDAIEAEASDVCNTKFADYVGIAYPDSKYQTMWMTPTLGSWTAAGDREVVCVLYDEGPMTGTARRSNQ